MRLAEAIRDICGVTQRAGEMAFEDVGMKLGGFAAAHRVDEIAEMARSALKGLKLLSFLITNNCGVVAWDDHRTAFAIDHDADVRAVILVHFVGVGALRQAADFEEQRRGFVIMKHD